MHKNIPVPRLNLSLLGRARHRWVALQGAPQLALGSGGIVTAAAAAAASLSGTVVLVAGHPGWRRHVQGAIVR